MLIRLRDSLITWVTDRGNTRPVAVLGHVGVRYEQAVRQLLDLQPEAVRRVWGLAGRIDLDRTRERLSALEHRVRALEARSDIKEDA